MKQSPGGEDRKWEGWERTCILQLDLIELLLVGLLGAGEDGGGEVLEVRGVLAGEQANGDLLLWGVDGSRGRSFRSHFVE